MARRKLFINYRRDDSRADAGRLYDRLHGRYPGRVFRDVGSLEPGVEWHDAIAKVLNASDACIVVIGPRWLTVTDAAGKRRIDDPRDTVRREVATAIGNGMRIFPVLVGGAKVPAEEDLPPDLQPLVRRNALEITEQDWDEDFDKLVRAIERALGWSGKKPRSPLSMVVAGVAGAAVVLAFAITYLSMKSPSPPVVTTKTEQPADSPKTQPAAKPPVEPKEAPAAPREAPVEPAKLGRVPRSTPAAGVWRAIANAGGPPIHERIEYFPDSSFRVLLANNNLAGLGTWSPDPATGGVNSSGVNFLNGNAHFTCQLAPTGVEMFFGRCVDARRGMWTVALDSLAPLNGVDVELPRVNLQGVTMAEKIAFAQMLATEGCPCGCRLNVTTCLEKDLTCNESPMIAQRELVKFLQIARR